MILSISKIRKNGKWVCQNKIQLMLATFPRRPVDLSRNDGKECFWVPIRRFSSNV